MKASDNIYAKPLDTIKNFEFDEKVAHVFPNMIARSIPGYSTVVDGIGQITAKIAKPNSNIYDLGCSLGAVSLSIAKYNKHKNCTIHGIDNSAAMVKQCQMHVDCFAYPTPINIELNNIETIKLVNPSVAVMNFTLQFIAPERRHGLLSNIYDSLAPGAALILSEKIVHDNILGESLIVDLHHEFKRSNGYSDLEISQKRSALENVMLLDTLTSHKNRLQEIGFSDVVVWFQQLNFISLIAIK